ncbi:MAG: hypothetical protein ACRD1R_12385, partial [Acidobacteriota bacterium]
GSAIEIIGNQGRLFTPFKRMKDNCTQAIFGPYDQTYDSTWSSGDTSVITTDQTGWLNCVGAGSTGIQAGWQETVAYDAACVAIVVTIAVGGGIDVCDLEIVSPANGQILSLGSDYRTAQVPLRAESNCSATVSWTLDFSYTTSGNRGPFSTRRTATSATNQTINFSTNSEGGQVNITARITVAGQTITTTKSAFVVGVAIPDNTITERLDTIYDGARTRLMTGIAAKESSYRQFHNILLYGSVDRWPVESFDGGSHIGLMMVVTNMSRAYNWETNTQDGRDLFVAEKLVFSGNYVNQVRQSHPNLRDLSAAEHEMNALVFYGPHASATQHYYEPNSSFTDWIVNTAGNPDGVAYADDVISLMR